MKTQSNHYHLQQMVLLATFLALFLILDTMTTVFLKNFITIPIIHQKCLLIATVPLMLMILLMPVTYSIWGLSSIILFQYFIYHYAHDHFIYHSYHLERSGYSFSKWHHINTIFHILIPYVSYLLLLLAKTKRPLYRLRFVLLIIMIMLLQTGSKTINGSLLYLPAIKSYLPFSHLMIYITILSLQLIAHLIHHLICGICVYFLYHKLINYYQCHFVKHHVLK